MGAAVQAGSPGAPARRRPLAFLSAHHLHRPRRQLLALVVLAATLQLAATAGLAGLAGFPAVGAAFARTDPAWLALAAGAVAVSFAGYYYAYRGVHRVEGGPCLHRRELRAVVAAGFAGFLGHGGDGLDGHVLRLAGSDRRDSAVRVSALAGLEQGVLALLAAAAAIELLVAAAHRPGPSFTVPWAVIPLPGLLLAFWLGERYRHRFSGRPGWRDKLAIFLDSIHLIRELFVHPLRHGPAVSGMALFWAGDMLAAWAGLAAVGVRMDVAALVVGYATGLVVTRRVGPLGGAGVISAVLPLTIAYSGAPLAAVIAGVFYYRACTLWLPLPYSLLELPVLRQLDAATANSR